MTFVCNKICPILPAPCRFSFWLVIGDGRMAVQNEEASGCSCATIPTQAMLATHQTVDILLHPMPLQIGFSHWENCLLPIPLTPMTSHSPLACLPGNSLFLSRSNSSIAYLLWAAFSTLPQSVLAPSFAPLQIHWDSPTLQASVTCLEENPPLPSPQLLTCHLSQPFPGEDWLWHGSITPTVMALQRPWFQSLTHCAP